MTLLALFRHSDTAWNREGRIQGRTDIALSDEGRAKLHLRTLPLECRAFRVLTSPLARCRETAALLSLGEAQIDARLAETRWGEWEGRRLEDLRAEFGDEMRHNEARGIDFRPPGGESPRDVFARVGGLLEEIALDRRPTLAITHKGVIRAIFAAAAGWDMRGRPPLKLDWAAVHLFRLDPSGSPSLSHMNIPLSNACPEPRT